MKEEKSSRQRRRGDAPGRPRYERPVLVPLGEMARGYGAQCNPGSQAGAVPGECKAGTYANPGKCKPGVGVGTIP